MLLVGCRIGVISRLITASGVAGAAYLGGRGRGQPRGVNDGGNLVPGNCLDMIAPRSVAGLTGDPLLDEGFLLRIHSGGMTPGALFEPLSFAGLVGKVGLPLSVADVVLGWQDNKILTLSLQILLLPLAAQDIVDVFFAERSGFTGRLKISDVRHGFALDITHHPGMKGSLPLQVRPFVAPFAGFRGNEGGAESIGIFSLQLCSLVY